MPNETFHYLGSGRVYVNGRRVGVCSVLNIEPQEQTVELPDRENPGGGLANSVSRVTSVQASMTLWDLHPENVALALRGSVTAIQAGDVVDEPISVVADRLTRTEFIGIADVLVTSDDGVTEYDAGVDYEVTGGGIVPLPGGALSGATEAEPIDLLITYEYGKQQVVEALVRSGQEFEISFVGINEAKTGTPRVVDIYRFRPSPTQNLGLISGDEFSSMEMTGRVLRDASKGEGLSGYFRDIQASAA